MRQFGLLPLTPLILALGCDRSDTLDAASLAPPKPGGIVSLSPAATDLLVAMGLADRVVAVSPYEANDRLRRTLPKVGDYERIDWERVTALKPRYLIVQGRKDRMPAGQRERCQTLGIVPVILQIDRLDDVRRSIVQLGNALGETTAAARAAIDFDRRRDALRAAAPASPTPALLTFSDDATRVAGTDTFLNDALELVGGVNVVAAPGYPTLDREKLASLRPAVVFVLLPGGRTAATQRAVGTLRGVAPNARVVSLTGDTALMPGVCVLSLAEAMARGLGDAPKDPQ